MKKTMTIILLSGLVGILAGCEPSAQEKIAQEQLKAIEQQKLIMQGFEEAAKKAKAESKAHPIGQEKQVYKKLNLYPPKE